MSKLRYFGLVTLIRYTSVEQAASKPAPARILWGVDGLGVRLFIL